MRMRCWNRKSARANGTHLAAKLRRSSVNTIEKLLRLTAHFNASRHSNETGAAVDDHEAKACIWQNITGVGYGGGNSGGEFGGAFAQYGPNYLWPDRDYGGSRRGYELHCTGGHGYDGRAGYPGVPSARVREALNGRGLGHTERPRSCLENHRPNGARGTATPSSSPHRS
jgi:hypothetical protein